MDLPTCPACGQSVLDDDVEDCPFCGASMSGKPSAGTRKPAAASAGGGASAAGTARESRAGTKDAAARGAKSGAAAPAAGGSKAPAAKGGVPAARDDDGFDDPAQAARNAAAIPVRTRPLKGPSIEVVCPMCETAGFVPKQAAGKDVRCANPQCLVPIFRLPDRADDDDAKKKPQKSSKLLVATVLGVVLLGGGGFAFWWFALRTPYVKPIALLPNPGGTTPKPSDAPVKSDPQTDEKSPPVDPKSATAAKGPDPAPADKVSPAALRKELLVLMDDVAKRSTNNRSKADCRRVAATVHARLGDVDEARRQIEQLVLVGKAVPFYPVDPLSEIAWWQLRHAEPDAARRTLAEALASSASLPANGQSSQEFASRLAGLLAAEGRFDEAAALVAEHRSEPALERLGFDLARELEYGTCDVAALEHWSPSTAPLAAPETAAAFWLAVRGDGEAGRKWLAVMPAGPVRNAVLVTLAEAMPVAEAGGAAGDLRGLLAGAEPHVTARASAARAFRLVRAGRAAESAKQAAAAESALGGLVLPVAAAVPETRALLTWPGTDPAVQSAFAAASDLAAVRALLGDSPGAAAACTLALQWLRALAPPARLVQPLVDENVRRGPTGVAAWLQSNLKLSATAARDASSVYRRQCDALRTAALARDEAESQLLEAAVRWGLLDLVRQQTDPVGSPAFDQTAVPWLLADALRTKDDAAAADAIEAALRGRKAVAPARVSMMRKVAPQIAAGKARAAGEAIRKADAVPRADKARVAAAHATRIADAGKPADAIDLLEAAGDQVVYERMLEILAARSVRRGQVVPFWKLVKDRSLDATEFVSACRGLVLALPAGDSSPEGDKARTAETKDGAGTKNGTTKTPGGTATGAPVP